MVYGDEVIIVAGGPRIAAKSLEPIGISDGSRCWGVWVADNPEDARTHPPARYGGRRTLAQPPSLLISPFHPSLWPFLFHAEVRIQDRPGTVARASYVLAEMRVNILFEEFVKSGYKHSVWHVVGDAESLRTAIHDAVRRVAIQPMGSESIRDIVRNAFRESGIHDASVFDHLVASIEGLSRGPSALHSATSLEALLLGLDRKRRQEILGRVGQSMLRFLIQLEERFRKYDEDLRNSDRLSRSSTDDDDVGFLYDKFLSPPLERPANDETGRNRIPWSLYDSDLKVTEKDMFHRHDWNAVRCMAMPRLASYWAFGASTATPIAFRYRASRAHVEPDDPHAFGEEIQKMFSRTPEVSSQAIASFDRSEYSVRLFLFEKRVLDRHLLEINIEYAAAPRSATLSDLGEPVSTPSGGGTVRAMTTGDTARRSSRGFLNKLCVNLQNVDLDLRRVTNRITRWRKDYEESGYIRIVAEVLGRTATDVARKVEDAITAAANELNADRPPSGTSVGRAREDLDWQLTISKAVVRPYPHFRMFMSTPLSFPRFADIKEMVDELAGKHGIIPIWAETYSGSVSENVVNELRRCHAFLQLVTLKRTEHEDLIRGRPLVPDFGWLHYEYGLADALGMRPVRLIDVNVPHELIDRYAKVRRDTADLGFDTKASNADLRRALDAAINEVIKVLLSDPEPI